MKQPQEEILLALRNEIGMNRKEFAEYLSIPYRTMEDWETGKRKMPDYVLRLIIYKVKTEHITKETIKQEDSNL